MLEQKNSESGKSKKCSCLNCCWCYCFSVLLLIFISWLYMFYFLIEEKVGIWLCPFIISRKNRHLKSKFMEKIKKKISIFHTITMKLRSNRVYVCDEEATTSTSTSKKSEKRNQGAQSRNETTPTIQTTTAATKSMRQTIHELCTRSIYLLPDILDTIGGIHTIWNIFNAYIFQREEHFEVHCHGIHHIPFKTAKWQEWVCQYQKFMRLFFELLSFFKLIFISVGRSIL